MQQYLEMWKWPCLGWQAGLRNGFGPLHPPGETRRVWAGKINSKFNSRNATEYGSRVVEFEIRLRYQHQVWHWVLRCLQALYGFCVASTGQLHEDTLQPAVSLAKHLRLLWQVLWAWNLAPVRLFACSRQELVLCWAGEALTLLLRCWSCGKEHKVAALWLHLWPTMGLDGSHFDICLPSSAFWDGQHHPPSSFLSV